MSEQLYVMGRIDENGNQRIIGYAYGESWVAQALYMNDWKYNTEAEAREAWEKYKKETAGKEVCI